MKGGTQKSSSTINHPQIMEKNQPVKTIKLGAVEANIWENETDSGRKTHSVTFKRSYKDGEEWKTSDSYWTEHLPLLVKAADAAHTAILTELKGK
jgi:hypothetical protein